MHFIKRREEKITDRVELSPSTHFLRHHFVENIFVEAKGSNTKGVKTKNKIKQQYVLEMYTYIFKILISGTLVTLSFVANVSVFKTNVK